MLKLKTMQCEIVICFSTKLWRHPFLTNSSPSPSLQPFITHDSQSDIRTFPSPPPKQLLLQITRVRVYEQRCMELRCSVRRLRQRKHSSKLREPEPALDHVAVELGVLPKRIHGETPYELSYDKDCGNHGREAPNVSWVFRVWYAAS